MSEPTPPRPAARETRLLLITLAVSVAALLLLARFRFPERAIADLSPPQPLTRLTRVTAFDELSAMLGDLLRQFEGAVVSVRLAPMPGAVAAASAFAGLPGGRPLPPGADAPTALALVVANDLALVPVPGGTRVIRAAGSTITPEAIVARDDERGLVAVRVPGHSAPELPATPAANPVEAPAYLAILEAAVEGPTIRAEFVSRVSRETHPAWDVPVLALGGAIRAQPGAFLFTLNGRFVGMTLDDGGRTLVVPAEPLLARAARLARGESLRIVDAGFSIQPMTPALAKATGAATGVVVNAVTHNPSAGQAAAAGRAATAQAAATARTTPAAQAAAAPAATGAGTVQPGVEVGDAITAMNGQAINTPREWYQALRARGPGATVALSIVRAGKRVTATWVLPRADATASRPPAASAAAGASASDTADALGISFRGAGSAGVGGGGARGVEVTDVQPAGVAARADLRVGDVITALPGRGAATAQALASAYDELPSGQALLLAVERHGAPFVTAIEKP